MADPADDRAISRRAAAGLLGAGAVAAGLAAEGCAATRPPAPTGSLYAGDHGIVGDGRTDETARVQAFLDLCRAAGGAIARFGTMRVRIGGPLLSTVGIVFDPAGYGEGDAPGFYVTGEGYTALTVTGGIADFNVTVAGGGEARHGPDGSIVGDTRPRVNGIAFGHPGEHQPLAASVIRHARAFKLAGFGVRHTTCYDCTFMAVSVEQCGTRDLYAFEVAGSAGYNCSENAWVRVQAESSACRAVFVHPNTLSCTIGKLHSERTAARRGDPAWVLGGACSFDAVRLHANDPADASARITGQQTTITNLRLDDWDKVPVEVDATNGRVVFHNPLATLAASPNQAGQVSVFGGAVNALRIGAGWSFFGTTLPRVEVGFMGTGGRATISQCEVGTLAPQRGQTTGAVAITGSTVAAATFAAADARIARVELLGGTRCASPRGARMAFQSVLVDAGSTIVGDVTLDHAALRLMGTVEGDLTVIAAPQSLAGMDAVVTGTVRGWTHPEADDLLGPHRPGMVCKNLRADAVDAGIRGWTFSGRGWMGFGR